MLNQIKLTKSCDSRGLVKRILWLFVENNCCALFVFAVCHLFMP